MRGASGSGKSTLVEHIRRFVEDPAYVPPPHPLFAELPSGVRVEVMSADHYFMDGGVYKFDRERLGLAHQYCLHRFVEFARTARWYGNPILIVDNTNTTLEEVAPYARVGAAYGLDVHIVDILSDQHTCEKMNVHDVPAKTIEGQIDRLTRSRGAVHRYGTTHVITSSHIPSLQP